MKGRTNGRHFIRETPSNLSEIVDIGAVSAYQRSY